MNSKPMLQSKTLWMNLVLAVAAFWVPEEMLSGEVKMLIGAGVNMLLRIFFTEKKLEGVV